MTETHSITDLAEVHRTLGLLLEPGQVTELRALSVSTPTYRRAHTVSGYFDDVEALVDSLGAIERTAKGIYIIPNPVDAALLARAANRLHDATDREPLTGDGDIVSRRWLPIDADPRRPAGTSSTDDQHDQAIGRVRRIRDTLGAAGWPEPILANSGNGGNLLYRLDVPRDDQGLIKRVLEALAFRFDDEKVLVDQTVFNPARIWKLYGTVARKGDSTMDRPHRLARILDAPARLAVVDAALLAELASSAPNDEKTSHVGAGVGDRFDLREWIARHGLDVIGPAPWRGGERWIFRVCPWNADHRGREWSACACRGDPAPPSRVRRHRGQDIEGPQGR